MKRRLPIILLLLLVGIMTTGNVYACSGGGYATWDDAVTDFVEESDTIVVGRFIELDDVEMNGIFQVESYLMGSGAEHLTVAMNDVRKIESRRNAHRYFNCGINGTKGSLTLDGQYVLFLTRNIDGVYYHHSWHWYRYFASPETTFTVHNEVEIDLETFLAQLTDKIGYAAIAPITETSYPRTTPIILTTRSGQQYILPVDGSAPVAITETEAITRRRDQYDCSPAPCTAFSPNSLDVVYLIREGDTHERPNDYAITQEHYVVGSRVSFAANSETFALWQGNELQLYMLWYPDYGYPDEQYISLSMQSTPVKVNTIEVDASSINYPAVWSPNGQTLAFSDDEGLWLWDVFSVDYPPQLLLPRVGDTVPVARYYSPQGRYLAVTVGTDHYNLDLVTRRELPDGYISPNDRLMLVFDTAAENSSSLDIAYIMPGIRQFNYSFEINYHQVQWLDNESFVAVVSGQGYLEYETGEEIEPGVYEAIPYLVDEPFFDVVQLPVLIGSSRQVPYGVNYTQPNRFDYQYGSGLITYAINTCRISANGRVIDLTPYLPEPIVSAEWLPSAFYYEDEN